MKGFNPNSFNQIMFNVKNKTTKLFGRPLFNPEMFNVQDFSIGRLFSRGLFNKSIFNTGDGSETILLSGVESSVEIGAVQVTPENLPTWLYGWFWSQFNRVKAALLKLSGFESFCEVGRITVDTSHREIVRMIGCENATKEEIEMVQALICMGVL